MMKRYLVFGGDSYYPCGGWEDFIKSVDTLEEAKLVVTDELKALRSYPGVNSWKHIVDTATMEIVDKSK